MDTVAVADDCVLFAGRGRTPVVEQCEGMFEFAPVGWRGERDSDSAVGQAEAVTIGGCGRLNTGRVFRRGFEERLPAEPGESDNGHFPLGCDGKDIAFGAAMGGVVANHQHIEAAGSRPGSGERALMAGETDQTQPVLPFLSVQEFPDAAGGNDFLPFLIGFHVVKRRDIDIVAAELLKQGGEFPFGFSGGSGLKLDGDYDLSPSLAQPGDCAAQAVGMPAPIQVVDPTLDGPLDVPRFQS
jgi:hypothetical protein